MRFSVIIPTWNREDDLRDCLTSVLKQKGVDFEVLVIDNGSDDGTQAYCRTLMEHDQRVRYFRFDRNMGITIAENKGLAEACGDIIFCFDDDQFLEDDNFLTQADEISRERKWDILNMSLINTYTKENEDHLLYAQKSRNNPGMSFYTNNFSNGTVLIKKSVIEKIGYFEEFYFRQSQENEFAQRAILYGFNLLYYPALSIQHKRNPHRPPTREVSYYGFRNTMLKNYKFFSGWRLWSLQLWQILQFFGRLLLGHISPRLFAKAIIDYRNLKPQVKRILDYEPAAMRRYFFLSRRTPATLDDIGTLGFFRYYFEGLARFS